MAKSKVLKTGSFQEVERNRNTLTEAARRMLAVVENAKGWVAYNTKPDTLAALTQLVNAGLVETNAKNEMRKRVFNVVTGGADV